MERRERQWQIAVIVLVIAMCAVWAVPVAATLALADGDEAAVAYTGGDGVNVRAAASTDASILATLPEGYAVSIQSDPIFANDGSAWYAVEASITDGTIEGWVAADFLTESNQASGYSDSPVAPDDSDYAARGVPAIVAASGGALNLRADPTIDSYVIFSIPDGTTVDVLEPVVMDADGNSWSQVRYDKFVGYVASDYLSTDLDSFGLWPSAAITEITLATGLAIGTLAVVSGTDGDGLLVRNEPMVEATTIASLGDGDTTLLVDGPVTDDAGSDWYQVTSTDGVGWVHGDYLTATSVAGSGSAIVAEALTYLGVPYLWGGTTPDGFDCSGFTWYLLNEVFGYDVARPIEDQLASGRYVAPDELLPGDLIFFRNTYQWGLSHVGIYLGRRRVHQRNGQFDAVGISDLSDPYWSVRYLESRRIG